MQCSDMIVEKARSCAGDMPFMNLLGEVLVKIQYSDLNYKDALILNNGGRII